MTRFWDGRTDGRSNCTPRPAFAFGDAGKNRVIKFDEENLPWFEVGYDL